MSEVIYSQLAQQTISELVQELQRGVHLHDALADALKTLVTGLSVDRGLIWQVAGDRLTVTHEYSPDREKSELSGVFLSQADSMPIILHFLVSFPEAGAPGVLQFNAGSKEESPWEPLMLLSPGYQAASFIQLRTDIFVGFISLQSKSQRSWSTSDLDTLQKVGTVVSVLLKDYFDIARITLEATGLDLLVKILSLFVDQGATPSKCAAQSVGLIAEHMGFKQSCLYLETGGRLIPQGDGDASLNLTDKDNPFVGAFLSGQITIIGEGTPDPLRQFGAHRGFIVPLTTEEKPLGVFALWERANNQAFYAIDLELADWFSTELCKCLMARTFHSAK
jgi:hypothetical protein